jgi:hypothetical protein
MELRITARCGVAIVCGVAVVCGLTLLAAGRGSGGTSTASTPAAASSAVVTALGVVSTAAQNLLAAVNTSCLSASPS